MIQKRLLAAGLATTTLLVACGGGGGGDAGSGGGTVSKLSNTDNVAGFASSLASSQKYLLSGINLAGNSSSAQCDSGNRVFTEDSSTVNGSDGTTVYNSCQNVNQSDGGTTTEQYNGKISTKCTDGAQTANNCLAQTARFADGPTASSTLDASVVTTGSAPQNLELKLKGDVAFSQSSSTSTIDINATIGVNDRQRQLGGTATFENLRLVYTSGNSTYTQSFDGGFGFTGIQSGCALGKVTLRTNSPVVYSDSNNSTLGGQITLSDSLGQSARIDFNSDGSATVTLSNGQTKTYTAAQLAALC